MITFTIISIAVLIVVIGFLLYKIKSQKELICDLQDYY